MSLWRIVLALLSGVLAACTANVPAPSRSPAAIAPTPEDWRAAAHDIAADLIRDGAKYVSSGPMTLAPIEGDAPPFFREFLLVGLIGGGVPVAEIEPAPLRLTCRVTPARGPMRPRGLRRATIASQPELLVLCLLAHEGAYVAAEHRMLSTTSDSEPGTGNVVVEVSK